MNRHSLVSLKIGPYLYAFGGMDSKGIKTDIERLDVTDSNSLWKRLDYKL